MNAEQCRAEATMCDELEARADGQDGREMFFQMSAMSAKALWEIAAQLAELNENGVKIYRKLDDILSKMPTT